MLNGPCIRQGHRQVRINFTSKVFRLISYCHSKLQLLLSAGVKPVIVFDGCRLEMKGNTEAERRKNRKEAREKAEEFLRQGNGMMAQRKFAEAVDITPQMAYEFIQLLKSQGVEYYVAPYEADAQLAYLYLTKRVRAVITEDSDLLIFGVKRVLFKMDKLGNGTEIDLERL